MTHSIDTAIGLVICAIWSSLFVFAFTSIEGDPAPISLPWRAP
jgi:hypothetical protein